MASWPAANALAICSRVSTSQHTSLPAKAWQVTPSLSCGKGCGLIVSVTSTSKPSACVLTTGLAHAALTGAEVVYALAAATRASMLVTTSFIIMVVCMYVCMYVFIYLCVCVFVCKFVSL